MIQLMFHYFILLGRFYLGNKIKLAFLFNAFRSGFVRKIQITRVSRSNWSCSWHDRETVLLRPSSLAIFPSQFYNEHRGIRGSLFRSYLVPPRTRFQLVIVLLSDRRERERKGERGERKRERREREREHSHSIQKILTTKWRISCLQLKDFYSVFYLRFRYDVGSHFNYGKISFTNSFFQLVITDTDEFVDTKFLGNLIVRRRRGCHFLITSLALNSLPIAILVSTKLCRQRNYDRLLILPSSDDR